MKPAMDTKPICAAQTESPVRQRDRSVLTPSQHAAERSPLDDDVVLPRHASAPQRHRDPYTTQWHRVRRRQCEQRKTCTTTDPTLCRHS